MATKRYYWLKLEEHFFKSNSIKIIKRMEDGYKFIVLYLQMLLLAINDNGQLFVGEGVPFDAQMLSLVVDMEEEDVISALRLFEKLKLIETKDGVIKLLNFDDIVGSETADARRMRNKKAKSCEIFSKASENFSIDIDIDKDINKDIDIDKEREDVGVGTQKGTPTQNNKNCFENVSYIPSLEEVKAYSQSRQSGVDVEKFYDHYSAVGWMMGSTPIKDWKAAFRKWEKTEKHVGTNSYDRDFSYRKYDNNSSAKENDAPYVPSQSSASESFGSFDTDDIFIAALKRSYGDDAIVENLVKKVIE